jgi:Kef-type K+ transport system membrane component KefB
MELLLLLGVAALIGWLGGKLFQYLKIPRVVGYIVIGLLLGDSFARILSVELVTELSPLTDLALALIGLMVGGELKKSVFQRFGRQMITILLCEGLAAFALVSLLVTWFTGEPALGLVLGALASATAPAATVDVLWEYKSRGPLTTTILGIVALDDGLALVLYGFAVAFATVLLVGGPPSWGESIGRPLLEIFGSVGLGIAAGSGLTWLLRRVQGQEDLLVLMLGAVLIVAGVARSLDLSLILAEMALGVTLVNSAPNTSRAAFEVIKGITPPIYILFFVLVGARLQVDLLPQMGLLGLLYVAGRTAGKFAGSWLGGTLSHAPEPVRKYLGFALFSQAGVAVGLALDVAQRFAQSGLAAQEMGAFVINVIGATTFLVQIIGPPFVKFAISRAGEIPSKGGEDSDENP